MPQTNQFPTLLPNSSQPTFDPLYPLGNRGAGGNLYSENFEGVSPSDTTNIQWTGPTFNEVYTKAPRSSGSGTRSLRFRYPAGENISWEERWTSTVAHQELYIRFWLQVPSNFAPRDGASNNSKLFAIWMDDYSGAGNGPTVIWEFWSEPALSRSVVTFHFSTGGFTGAGAHLQDAYFAGVADQGRWMELCIHVKAATTTSSNDGVIELFRRWEGEPWALLHQYLVADIGPPAGGPNGWKNGYFMGWSNPGYVAQTDFWLDDMQFSTAKFEDLP